MRLKGVVFSKLLIFEFLDLFWIFNLIFKLILLSYLLIKSRKKGVYLPQDRGADVVHEADVACGTSADATRH